MHLYSKKKKKKFYRPVKIGPIIKRYSQVGMPDFDFLLEMLLKVHYLFLGEAQPFFDSALLQLFCYENK